MTLEELDRIEGLSAHALGTEWISQLEQRGSYFGELAKTIREQAARIAELEAALGVVSLPDGVKEPSYCVCPNEN